MILRPAEQALGRVLLDLVQDPDIRSSRFDSDLDADDYRARLRALLYLDVDAFREAILLLDPDDDWAPFLLRLFVLRLASLSRCSARRPHVRRAHHIRVASLPVWQDKRGCGAGAGLLGSTLEFRDSSGSSAGASGPPRASPSPLRITHRTDAGDFHCTALPGHGRFQVPEPGETNEHQRAPAVAISGGSGTPPRRSDRRRPLVSDGPGTVLTQSACADLSTAC
jgi:hypothetical protein